MTAATDAEPPAGAARHHQTARTVAAAADLPFSFVGDVVTWPYVKAYSFINQPVPTPPVFEVPTPPGNAPRVTAPAPALPEPPATTDDRPQTLPSPAP